jgi:hypothetical protein
MTDSIYAKIETARSKGISDEAIKKFLMDHPLVEDARKKGVADEKIFSHLGLVEPEPGVLDTLASEASTILGNIEPDVMAIGESLTPMQLSRTINRAVMSPLETAKGAVSSISEFVQDPYTAFKERPVSTLLGVAPFLSGGVRLAAGGRRLAAPVLEPQRGAVQNVMSNLAQPQEFANAMARPVPVTPGAPSATASQAAVAAGLSEPAVAGLESNLMNVTAPYGREVFALREQRLSAIQQQIRRIDQDIMQRADAMSPAEMTQLKTVRDDLMRQLANERQGMAQQGQALETQLPPVSMREQGQVIQETARGIKKGLKQQVIEPAYTKPIQKAGSAKIDITPVVSLSEQVLGKPLTQLQPETAPGQLASALAKLRRPPSEGEWVSLGEGAGYYGEPGPPPPTTATLAQIHDIRRAINADLSEAATAGPRDAGAATRYNALRAMLDRIDTALEKTGAIPQSVKEEYKKANELYKVQYAPRIKTGITGDMLQRTARGETKLLPDDIVDSVLENETNAAQFNTTFQGNPTAKAALDASIINRVRNKALNATTGLIDAEKIDSFVQDKAPALQTLGVDLQATLKPLRDEAARISTGMAELEARAKKVGKSDATKVVDQALKNAPEMRFILDRISPEAQDALRKNVTDRALAFIKTGETKKALQYLTNFKKPLRIAIGDEAIEDLRGLANAQNILKETEKRAPAPELEVATELGKFTREQLTDINTLIDEIDRLEKVTNLSNVRPTISASNLAAQAGIEASQVPPLMMRAVTFTKGLIDKISTIATSRMQVQMANLLVKDRAKLGQLINEELAKKTRKLPSTRAAAATAIVSAPQQNRNAMAR